MSSFIRKIKVSVISLLEAITLLFQFLLAFLLWLLGQRKRRNPRQPSECFMVPPDVSRAPDPCLYSQTYLMAQGISVTWDNPDIQITTLLGVPVESSALEPDTDYLVNAEIHNASFDAAIGVEVICVYRPWSFGNEDRVPVETDGDGNAAIRVLNIGAWESRKASFKWTTPALQPGDDREHYCIQVECFHPADREPNNNIGQENTNVVRTTSPATIDIPLQNLRDIQQTIRFEVDEYTIPADKIEMALARVDRISSAPQRRLYRSSIKSDRETRGQIGSAIRGAHIRINTPSRPGSRERMYSVHGYSVGSELRKSNRRGGFPINNKWSVKLNQTKDLEIILDPHASKTVTVEIEPDSTVASGENMNININAFNEDDTLLGGVTLTVEAM